MPQPERRRRVSREGLENQAPRRATNVDNSWTSLPLRAIFKRFAQPGADATAQQTLRASRAPKRESVLAIHILPCGNSPVSASFRTFDSAKASHRHTDPL